MRGWGAGRLDLVTGRVSQGGMAAWLSKRLRRDKEFALPVEPILTSGAWLGQGRHILSSGQLPGSVVEGQPQGKEPAQVQAGEAVLQPGVVLGHAPVGDSA